MITEVLTTSDETNSVCSVPVAGKQQFAQELARRTRLCGLAMRSPDDWVVEFDYRNADGEWKHRVVSPIRMSRENRVLALCLSRESIREFVLAKCANFSLARSNDFLMPIPMPCSSETARQVVRQ